MQAFCSDCGAAITPGSKFCGSCGEPLDHVSSPAGQDLGKQEPERVDVIRIPETEGFRFSAFLKNRVHFVAAYILAIVPTYFLPFLGSNSGFVSAIASTTGLGQFYTFWAHVGFLCLAFVLAWFRGVYVGKAWIAIFPFLASIFDMVPGLNWFFLLPSIFHVITLVTGVRDEPNGSVVTTRQAWIAAPILGVPLVMFIIQLNNYTTPMDESQKRYSSPNTRAEPPSASAKSSPPPPPKSVVISGQPNFPPDVKKLVDQFLRENSKLYRLALLSDCKCENDLPHLRKNYANSQPYYAAGDFNGDGIEDYAIVVVEKGVDINKPLSFNASIFLFDGPLGGRNQKISMVRRVGVPNSTILFLQQDKKTLAFGQFEGSTSVLQYKNGAYGLADPPR